MALKQDPDCKKAYTHKIVAGISACTMISQQYYCKCGL